MALTMAQAFSKVRGSARRAQRAVKGIEQTPRGLINISAHADLSIARTDLDAAVDAIQAREKRVWTRGRRKHGKSA